MKSMDAGAKAKNGTNEELSAALLVLNWNGRALLETGLPLLLDQTYQNYEVVVVDNNSSDGSSSFITENFPQVRLIQNETNIGFSRALNVGLRQLNNDVVVLLNNDVFVQPDWLEQLLYPFTESPQIGVVGCKLLYPDGTIQHLGAELTYPLAHSHHFYYKQAESTTQDLPAIQDVPYVTGAAMAIHRSVMDKIGLLDEMFHPIYYEEVDYCYRARSAGFRVVVNTKAKAIHNESTSMNRLQDFKLKMLQRNRYRFVLKHYSLEQFLQDFVPAETSYLADHRLFQNVDAIRLICLEMAINAPTILPTTSLPEQVTAVQNALLELRQAATLASVNQEQHPEPLHEFTFPETGSRLQPLIASFRRAWSSVAAKWLVRSLLQQQHLHNQFLQRQIERLNTQTRSQAMEIEHLMAAFLPIQQELKQLQTTVSMLQPQPEKETNSESGLLP